MDWVKITVPGSHLTNHELSALVARCAQAARRLGILDVDLLRVLRSDGGTDVFFPPERAGLLREPELRTIGWRWSPTEPPDTSYATAIRI